MALINTSIENFDWPKLFLGTNVHEKDILFDKTTLIFFLQISSKQEFYM